MQTYLNIFFHCCHRWKITRRRRPDLFNLEHTNIHNQSVVFALCWSEATCRCCKVRIWVGFYDVLSHGQISTWLDSSGCRKSFNYATDQLNYNIAENRMKWMSKRKFDWRIEQGNWEWKNPKLKNVRYSKRQNEFRWENAILRCECEGKSFI